MISVQNLSKNYRTQDGELTALADVSAEIPAGEFIAVVGPSGCGKSTLLKILAGLVKGTSGEIRLGGTPVVGPRRDIGIVFQSPVLFPWRTVLDNVLLPAQIQKLDRAKHAERASELLRLVGLADFAHRYPWELSGGMQQRVAICRALLNDPAVLLMDEPFGALDAMTREHLNLELQRIWLEKRKTVVFITHSISESVFLGDRVLVMTPRPGRVVEDLRIEIPRPRSFGVMTTPVFGEYVARIRALFNVAGGLDS